MMKKLFKIPTLALSILFTFTACDNYAPEFSCNCSESECTSEQQSSPSDSSSEEVTSEKEDIVKLANVNVDLSAQKLEISDYIYGTFIEHISTCIYTSIWSELIMDRKFYYPIEERNSQWKKIGDKDVVSDTTNNFPGNNYSPILKNGSGISNTSKIHFNKDKEYDGYIYVKGSGLLEISIVNKEAKLVSKYIDISSPSDYQKYTFDFNCSWEDDNTYLEISMLTGIGEIGSPSIMPSDNILGMRKDTLELLKKLNAPFYRWPGGNFVSGYNWEDGIGDRDKRPSWRNYEYAGIPYGDPHCGDWNAAGFHPHFSSEEEMDQYDMNSILKRSFYSVFDSNDFGIDEFITFCKYLNAEPNIVVNAGYNGKTQNYNTASDAANEVAYCNSVGTTYGNKRPSKTPYNVKYWSIGNEMNGDWQLGHVGISEYKTRHTSFYNAMIAVDPSIKIIAVGDNASEWGSQMTSLSSQMNYISEHFYAPRDDNNVCNHITNMKKMVESRIKYHRNYGTAFTNKVKISFDEYSFENASQASMLVDGMAVASALNTFIYNSDVVEIACYSSTVNVTQGSITTDEYGAYMEGNGYALSLYRNYFEKYAVPISTDYKVNDKENYFELAAAISLDQKTLTVSVINTADHSIKLDGINYYNKVHYNTVYSDYLSGYNSHAHIEILEEEGELDEPIVKPQSITILTFNIGK